MIVRGRSYIASGAPTPISAGLLAMTWRTTLCGPFRADLGGGDAFRFRRLTPTATHVPPFQGGQRRTLRLRRCILSGRAIIFQLPTANCQPPTLRRLNQRRKMWEASFLIVSRGAIRSRSRRKRRL